MHAGGTPRLIVCAELPAGVCAAMLSRALQLRTRGVGRTGGRAVLAGASAAAVMAPAFLPVFGPGVRVKVCVVLRMGALRTIVHQIVHQKDRSPKGRVAPTSIQVPVFSGLSCALRRAHRPRHHHGVFRAPHSRDRRDRRNAGRRGYHNAQHIDNGSNAPGRHRSQCCSLHGSRSWLRQHCSSVMHHESACVVTRHDLN